MKRPSSEFIPIDPFYVSYYATDLRNADRYTHVIYKSPVDLSHDMKAGVYKDIELSTPSQSGITSFAERWIQLLDCLLLMIMIHNIFY